MSSKCSFVKIILYPSEPLLRKFSKILLVLNVIAVSLDPLFFYVPVIRDEEKCIGLDKKLMFKALVLRSLIDICDIINVIFQCRTGFVSARKYLFPYFLIDILAVLPLPQVVILIVIPKMRGSRVLHLRNLLIFFVFFQYVPRLFRIYPLYKKVKRTSGILTETAWAKAVFNLFLFLLASHVLGASWYYFSIERETTCWQKACESKHSGCVPSSFHCDDNLGNHIFLNDLCPVKTPNASLFDFGMFLDALQSGIVESTDFSEKFFHCFWWGLQNLSSFGQNLKTSRYVWENCFAVFITISGLVLFVALIGNMQIYLQSKTMRLEEMRLKGQDIEQWMCFPLLSKNLQKQIKSYQQYKWRKTRGVDVESLLFDLPRDLRMSIKRELCMGLLKRVPMFEKMDEQLLDAACERLKPVLYTADSYIVREKEPVDEMLFVMRGKLLAQMTTVNGGRTGFFNSSEYLEAGDFCGEELLTWALDPHSSSNLPTSTRTIRALVEVEAFSLMADELRFVASQFRRRHSKHLQHTYRFYSQQWRTWAAYYIQAAWRRYTRRMLEESLRVEEKRPSLGSSTVCASRFTASAQRARLPERLEEVMLQKPAEPDFTSY